MEEKRKIPFLLWPFWALLQLAVWILKVTGRLIGAILGLVLTITVIGAQLGVPLIVLGVMLMGKSIFG